MAVKQTGKIGEGKAGPGRKKGIPNKTTAVLKEAIITAAEQVGEDGGGTGGLTGYLVYIAKNDIKAFAGLLGKVLPMQVTGEDGGPITTITRIELVAPGYDDSTD